jgi:hypothetical protein
MDAFEKNVSWIKADIEGWTEDGREVILSIDEMNLM